MKVLRIAAVVVGAVALVATGIGAFAGAAGFLGVASSTFATIGTIAGIASAALGAAATLMTPKPGFGDAAPLSFQTNPQSGLPYPVGRTRLGGLKIFGATANSAGWPKDDLLFLGFLLSCAPIAAAPAFAADNVSISFDGSGQATTSPYAGWMSQALSPGEMPQASALSLTLNGVSVPGWGSSHKLSGMAHGLWALRYDTDGKHYEGGVPDPQWVGQWTLVYDPRLDSTYPGGSGSHRWDDESTHTWSRNGALIALKWARGHFANGKKVCGIGAPKANIRIEDFREAANVADVNGWGCGGVEMTTDSKWDILTRMLQSCGAVPTMTGAMIGCRVQTPRTSLCTIAGSELLDGLDYAACKPRRDRINSVLPRYRSEAHGWEVITGSAITVDDYVTADGGLRTLGLDLPLVQAEVGQSGYDGDLQAGQLSAYAICQGREATGEFTTGLKYVGVYTGDCVTLDAPSEGFDAVKILITSRSLDIASATIKFTFETETDDKHAFALGTSTTPPAAPTLTTPPEPISTAPLGSNLLVNPDFTTGLAGWTAWGDGDAGLPITRSRNDSGHFGQINTVSTKATGTAPAAGKYFDGYASIGPGATFLDQLLRWAVPVFPGERVYFSALLAGYRCNASLVCRFFDGAGVEVSGGGDTESSPMDGNQFVDGDPGEAHRLGRFLDVPADARYAIVHTRGQCPGLSSPTYDNPQFWAGQIFLAKVAQGQVVPPPYSSGPVDRAADATSENTAQDTSNVHGTPSDAVIASIAALGNTAGKSANLTLPGSTSPSVMGTVDFTAGPNGTFTLAGGGSYVDAGSGCAVSGYVEYRVGGSGGWTTVPGSSFTGGTSGGGYPNGFSLPSGLTISGSSMGLSGSSQVEFRVVGQKSTSNSISAAGSAILGVGWS